jgi:DNA (cytosine-5)-methyltransferase 1
LGGSRSGLFWHVVRIAEETKAPIVVLENVQGIRKFIPAVRDAFEGIGYEVRDGFLAASDVGAKHKRERWFAVAYSDSFAKRIKRRGSGWKNGSDSLQSLDSVEAWETSDLACVSERLRETKERNPKAFSLSLLEGDDWDSYAVFFLRMDNGLQHKGDRIRALGNGVVPQQAREAFQKLSGRIGAGS